jgi:multidrug efflux system membrane fusion protein
VRGWRHRAARFEEGADVKAGDVLFQIDPAPFKAALARAEADLARAQAVQQEAEARVKRYAPLVKIEAVSQQDFDSATATLRPGSRAFGQADVQTARLNLGYATVTAPISGRIGRALATEGALVGQGDATLMARIQQLDPIYVDFTQSPPMPCACVRPEGRRTGRRRRQALTAQVEGTDYQRQGALMFTDVAVDRGTGQVTLRGRFDNADGTLLPGMYVRVRTPQGTDRQAILVPQRAVQRGSDGEARVMVVGTGGLAEARAVRTGVMQGARWQITEGLHAGDQVIVGSPAGLAPGMPVLRAHSKLQRSEARVANVQVLHQSPELRLGRGAVHFPGRACW